MRIIGHGVDMESIAGVKKQIDSENMRWTDQFCSEAERAQANNPPLHYRYYTGRFVGKEAVAKALGTGFSGEITWRGIEILNTENGTPYVRLAAEVEQLATKMGITDWLISITYTEETALASVIAVGK